MAEKAEKHFFLLSPVISQMKDKHTKYLNITLFKCQCLTVTVTATTATTITFSE